MRSIVRHLYQRAIRLAPRDQAPYATHVPALIGISALLRPATVIEFGSGEYSTALFLDSIVFPTVKRLESFENDREWYMRMKRQFCGDERLQAHLGQADMASAVTIDALASADLIFVDDSDEVGRSKTIEAVATCCRTDTPVVVHDVDLWRLRYMTRMFKHRIFFRAYNPQTAVCWFDGGSSFHESLADLSHVITQNAQHLRVDDRIAWQHALQQFDRRRDDVDHPPADSRFGRL